MGDLTKVDPIPWTVRSLNLRPPLELAVRKLLARDSRARSVGGADYTSVIRADRVVDGRESLLYENAPWNSGAAKIGNYSPDALFRLERRPDHDSTLESGKID